MPKITNETLSHAAKAVDHLKEIAEGFRVKFATEMKLVEEQQARCVKQFLIAVELAIVSMEDPSFQANNTPIEVIKLRDDEPYGTF